MAEITLSSLTEGTLDGGGVFDALMRSAKVHLEQEFNKGAIRGPEYSTVYLGQLESSMQTALAFLMGREKANLEAQLLALQVELAQEQVLTAKVQRELVLAQVDLTKQQHLNAVTENTVLLAQECKLRAEYDYTMKNVLKSAAEITLLTQKTVTEKAQTMSLGVDDDSVIGRQKKLYEAQTTGFARDAEQKVAQQYIDVWKTLRMTDDGWQANATQGLDDATMGAVLARLRQGIGIVPSS